MMILYNNCYKQQPLYRKEETSSLESALKSLDNRKKWRSDNVRQKKDMRRPFSMEEIRAWTEKHIEAEEDLADRLKAERQPSMPQTKHSHGHLARAHLREGGYKTQAWSHNKPTQFTPLKMKCAQILQEVYNTHLMEFPHSTSRQLGSDRDEWCKFHWTHKRTIKDCRTLQI
ncbi:hypothetical protein CR513_49080, partial [Mucuna pruriens]